MTPPLSPSCLTVLALHVLCLVPGATLSARDRPNDWILFANGDEVGGRITQYTTEGIQVRPEASTSLLEIPLAAVAAWRRTLEAQPPVRKPSVRLHMHNGDRISGWLKSLDANALQIEGAWGKLKTTVERVEKIVILPEDTLHPHNLMMEDSPWTVLEPSKIQTREGVLQMDPHGWISQEIAHWPDRFVLDVVIRPLRNVPPAFELSLGGKKEGRPFSVGLYLHNKWQFAFNTSPTDHYKLETTVSKFVLPPGETRISIYGDWREGVFQYRINGILGEKWKFAPANQIRSEQIPLSLIFQNMDRVQIVEEVTLRKWSGILPDDESTNLSGGLRVTFANGDIMPVDAIRLGEGGMIWVDLTEGPELTLPPERFSKIHFPDSNTAREPAKGSLWKIGVFEDRLHFRSFSIREGKVRGTHENWAGEVEIDANLVRAAYLNPTPASLVVEQMRVKLRNGKNVSGTLESLEPQTLHFRPEWSSSRWEIPRETIYEIRNLRTTPPPPPPVAMTLQNGGRISGDQLRLDENRFSLLRGGKVHPMEPTPLRVEWPRAEDRVFLNAPPSHADASSTMKQAHKLLSPTPHRNPSPTSGAWFYELTEWPEQFRLRLNLTSNSGLLLAEIALYDRPSFLGEPPVGFLNILGNQVSFQQPNEPETPRTLWIVNHPDCSGKDTLLEIQGDQHSGNHQLWINGTSVKTWTLPTNTDRPIRGLGVSLHNGMSLKSMSLSAADIEPGTGDILLRSGAVASGKVVRIDAEGLHLEGGNATLPLKDVRAWTLPNPPEPAEPARSGIFLHATWDRLYVDQITIENGFVQASSPLAGKAISIPLQNVLLIRFPEKPD